MILTWWRTKGKEVNRWLETRVEMESGKRDARGRTDPTGPHFAKRRPRGCSETFGGKFPT